MRRIGSSQVSLRPERDIAWQGDRMVAESAEPWLTLECNPARWVGKLIEIRYRASLLDEPARPVFRFRLRDGSLIDRLGAAPIVGAGVWTGRVPQDTARISVSPTNRNGLFDFLIENLRTLSWPALLARGLRSRPRATRSAVLTRLIGWRPESDTNLTWATAAFDVETWPSWLKVRTRAYDPVGFDRPRFDWSTLDPIRIAVLGKEKNEFERTFASLIAQAFPHWIAFPLEPGDVATSADPRIRRVSAAEAADRLCGTGQGLIGVLRAGDVLEPHALAYVAEQAHRHPNHALFYGDAMVTLGGAAKPLLQPGWSPRLQMGASYLAGPLFVRPEKLPRVGLAALIRHGDLPASITSALSSSHVKPLRRVLARTTAGEAAVNATPDLRPHPAATATIVIPTRDHPALLRRIVQSVRARSRPESYRILVVDNGSAEPEARALLAELDGSADASVLSCPGPFRFSLMCNEAAAMARSDVLVFLNDDTEVLSDGWLDRLIGLAVDPSIGAVGAKLTYPDGRLQHIGVVVGMGESAGHFGALDAGEAPGWACRNKVLHEVSAVTGACLAVARDKFEAVGGFDAEHLPVELSDIDLCLKLAARGWQTVVDPAVHLMHEESASRGGATFRRHNVYGAQRDVFIDRWRHILRDDPFFHPGLSLYSWQAALG